LFRSLYLAREGADSCQRPLDCITLMELVVVMALGLSMAGAVLVNLRTGP
tara:strand:- start:216 stop:365 length:150 start_codon:yes stop_codon:yes gene_type:complete